MLFQFFACPPRFRRIAPNGMATWRSGGFCKTFSSATPAAVAPNRMLAAVHFVLYCQILQKTRNKLINNH